ncbi:MAG: rhamnogalacturonan lyase B N-terminal domain-containing protein [Polyangiaceae bacterium]
MRHPTSQPSFVVSTVRPIWAILLPFLGLACSGGDGSDGGHSNGGAGTNASTTGGYGGTDSGSKSSAGSGVGGSVLNGGTGGSGDLGGTTSTSSQAASGGNVSSGGTTTTSGGTAGGGNVSSGGTTPNTGGTTPNSGGATSNTGGATPNTGGATSNTGGTASGGATATGTSTPNIVAATCTTSESTADVEIAGTTDGCGTPNGSFGLTTTTDYYTVNTGSGLVFSVRRTDPSASTQAAGDISSLKYNGVEFQDQTRGSQVGVGLGGGTVSATTYGSNYIKITATATDGDLTHYYIAKNGCSNVYMATHFRCCSDSIVFPY